MDSSHRLPRLRSDLVISQQQVKDQTYFVIKDPITQKYFQLREPEYFLIRQFDGSHDYESIAGAVREKYNLNITAEAVEKFAARIEELYFFEGSRAEYETSSGRYLFRTRKSLFSRILFLKLKAHNPDKLLNRLLPVFRFLYSPIAITAMILIILSGVAIYSANLESFGFTPGDLFNIGSLLTIFFSLALIILLHEFAHALTCKYFGGEVREMGFLLLYFQLCFYSNLSDSWMFQRKSSRLAVIWAGLFFQLVIFAIAVFGWRITLIDSGINQFFWLTANVCIVTLLFNFNPLIKLDGYYLLSEMIDIPNLRSRAFAYARAKIIRLVGLEQEELSLSDREKRIFALYTIFAGAYSFLLIGYIMILVYQFLVDSLGGFGFVLFLLMVAIIFKSPVSKLTRFALRSDVMKVLFSRPRNLIASGIIFVSIIVISFVIPFDRTAGGDVIIRPVSEFTISQLSSQGLLELKLRQGGEKQKYKTEHLQLSTGELSVLRLTPLMEEGCRVKKGDTLATIISTQVSSGLDAARTELERLHGELALINAPPKPEEVERTQAELDAAEINVSQRKREVERNTKLLEKDLLSESEFEKSEWTLKLAKSMLDEARAHLKVLKSPPKPEEIAILNSRIATQDAKIQNLSTQKAAQVITSPIDGELIALYRNNVLFKVADMSQVEIAIPIADNSLEFIKDKAETRLKVRTFSGRVFTGTVTYIPHSAANTAGFDDKRARFEVRAVVNNSDNLLWEGMSGYAKISCGETSLFSLVAGVVKSYIRIEFWSWW